jgi:hypothetical protein
VCADDPGLEVIHRNVAGIDVGNQATMWRWRPAGMRSRCGSSGAGRRT